MAIPTLRSPTIQSGGLIPETHTAQGAGASPALEWRRIPPGRPFLTIVARSWLVSGRGETVHWLVFDILEFFGGLPQDAGQSANWTVGLNSNGDATFDPFPGTDPRRVRFDLFASSAPTGLDGPASWADIAATLKEQKALGPYGFEAYDASLPTLLGVSR